ncbi:MAG: hypothetical protein AABO58_03480 [Acidobacteriota bacterium]
MKTTLDVPDQVLRKAKAAAAVRNETLSDFVTAAIEARLVDTSTHDRFGWKSLFGLARPSDVAAVDRIVSRDLEPVDRAWSAGVPPAPAGRLGRP